MSDSRVAPESGLRPESETATNKMPPYRWTVMVYFASDDVDQYYVANLTKLKKAGSSDDITLLAQVDPTGTKQCTRYWLAKNTKVEEDVVNRFANNSAGSPDALVEFVRWGVCAAPADHYMVILWGHGDGWQNEDNAGRAAGRTITTGLDAAKISDMFQITVGADTGVDRLIRQLASVRGSESVPGSAPDVLDGQGLKKAFSKLRAEINKKIDIVGIDSCLMAMVEVAYQIRDSVDYLVASEDVTPTGSWPFDSIFCELVSHPEMTPDQLGQTVVRQYLITYLEQTRFVTESVCSLDRCEGLAWAVHTLAQKLIAALSNPTQRTAIMAARAMVQDYYIRDYVDLYNFCEILGNLLKSQNLDLVVACQKVKMVIGESNQDGVSGNGFIRAHGFYGYPLKDSHGASIYFPCSRFSRQYNRLDFATETAWGSFAETYVQLTDPNQPASQPAPEGGTAPGGILGGQLGDGQLGPGDPVVIPPDPLGEGHPKRTCLDTPNAEHGSQSEAA